jgi:uncharacterized protein (DUF362 family)
LEKVVVADLSDKLLAQAIEEVFAAFGGIRVALPTKEQVFIKPNAAHFVSHTYTSPQVLSALLAYLRDHGYDQLRVMDSSGQGVFTRLVFNIIGYDHVCRRFGARPVYLDERKTVSIALDGGSEPIEIPQLIYEELVVNREHSTYLSLPMLKTHSMTTVSLNIKGQAAFVADRYRSRDHNYRLHHHLAGVYRLIQPDFCLIDGLQAVVHGHCPPAAYVEQSLVDTHVLIGGKDALAVDAVGARILGYTLNEVEHLRLVAEWGLGTGRMEDIEVVGNLSRFVEKYPYQSLGRLPDDVDLVEGQECACLEGCKGGTLWVMEMLYNDFKGHGDFSVVYGKGIARSDLRGLRGDILIVGPCAIAEVEKELHTLYPDRHIYTVPEHFDLPQSITYLSRLMDVHPRNLVPLNPVHVAWLWGQARLNGLNAAIPFLGES